MGKVLLGMIGIAVVLMLVSALVAQLQSSPSALELARQSVEMEKLYQQAEIEAFWAPIRATVLNVSLIIVVMGGTLYAAARGVSQLAFFRAYATPDPRGLLPVLREDQDTARAALNGLHTTELARASIGPVPHNFAPHVTVNHRTDPRGTSVYPADESVKQIPATTDLATLHYTPSRDSILLALGPGGEPITVPAARLCHVALVGATGGGKSNLLRLIVPQLQAVGARVCLADPHYTQLDPESGEDWRLIEQRLHVAPAVSPGEIESLLGMLTEELELRLELRREGKRWGPSLFLALDELPVIADQVPGSVDKLGKLLREGRKVHIYSVGASQSMLVKVVGGDSSMREAYRTAFYVGGDLRSAAMLLDMPQRQIDEGLLTTGLAYLRCVATSPAQLVRVPYASNAGIAGLLSTSSATSPAASPERRIGFRPASSEVGSEVATAGPLRAHQDAESLTAEEARIVAAFLAGKSATDLAIELAGGRKGGEAYQRAAATVAAALRKALKR
jgi:hypothetical protein